MISIPLFLSKSHECSYLDNESAQSVFAHPAYPMTTAIYAQLLEQGFRRSGDDVYAPQCPACNACIPARVDVKKFTPNRSQKRCLKKNTHTQAVIKPATFEHAHYTMYLRYQAARHSEGSMENASPDEYMAFLGSSWCNTRFVELFIDNKLAGIAVIDQFKNTGSAVYTFFEPEFAHYSLGVYAVLWQIEQAKLQGKDYLYLGFWIKACQKMAYKSDYRPQILMNNQWQELIV